MGGDTRCQLESPFLGKREKKSPISNKKGGEKRLQDRWGGGKKKACEKEKPKEKLGEVLMSKLAYVSYWTFSSGRGTGGRKIKGEKEKRLGKGTKKKSSRSARVV